LLLFFKAVKTWDQWMCISHNVYHEQLQSDGRHTQCQLHAGNELSTRASAQRWLSPIEITEELSSLAAAATHFAQDW
jgi:hypothetical protein